jgi:predicted nuclease with TOPRIM domain
MAADVQRIENATASGQMQETQTKDLQLQLADMKSKLDAQTAEAQSCQAAEAEASGQLQKEQGKLAEVQDRVDRLDNTLQKVSGSPK